MRFTGRLLVRNSLLTFAGQIVPGLIGLVTIPALIQGLGAERFGVLAMAWVVLGYFTMFDLAGRATTKSVAEAIGKNQPERIPAIIWTAIGIQLGFGVVGAVTLAAATPALVFRGLAISSAHAPEARLTLMLVSLALPLVSCARNLRGVLEAAQRFDLVAWVQIPATSLVAAAPFLGMRAGLSLPAILSLIAACWTCGAAAYLVLACRLFPGLRRCRADRLLLRPLLRYGGWIALCNALLAVIGSADRLVVGAVLSVESLAYYIPPAEMVSRLMIIPSVLGIALFPVFSTLIACDRGKIERLYRRSLKFVLLAVGPVAAIAAIFAHELLRGWLGADIAGKSTAVFQILLAGLLFAALGQIPANLLDGMGRPDLRATTFLSYAAVYAGTLYWLTSRVGLAGAAIAWSMKAFVEAAVFFALSRRMLEKSKVGPGGAGLLRGSLALALLALLALSVKLTVPGLAPQAALLAACLAGFGVFAWRHVLDAADRSSLNGILAGGTEPPSSRRFPTPQTVEECQEPQRLPG